jgi:CRISPR type III-B/RAMP module-associated protein Cmr5
MQTNNQRYANVVFDHVQGIANQDNAGKYKTLCKKAGSLVRNAGLMQTLAFMLAKGMKDSEKHHHTLLEHLREEMIALHCIPTNTPDLHAFVRQSQLPVYMVLTRQVLLLLNWHKRQADTLITREDE